MRIPATFALIAIFASATASADDLFGSGNTRAESARVATLYVEVPLGVRDRRRAKPAFGLRLQEVAFTPSSFAVSGGRGGIRTLVDVPLLVRREDPLRDSGATMLLGTGMIVGIVVGAVVAVSVLSDDDGDGDGGY